MNLASKGMMANAVRGGAALLTCLCGATALAQSSSPSFVLAQSTDGGAGGNAQSPSFVLDGTLAQSSVVGEASSASFLLQSGFWTSGSQVVTLDVLGAGSGAGTVSGTGINCALDAGVASGQCSSSFASGQSRQLLATAAAGSAFDLWAGCDSTSTTTVPGDTCQVLVTAPLQVTAFHTALGGVGDRVWRDIDGDGSQGPTEPGIGGVRLLLSGPSTNTERLTDGNGDYAFGDLYPGAYQLSVDTATLPPGVVPSFDLDGIATPHTAQVAILDGVQRTDADFGYQPLADLQLQKVDAVDPLPGGQPLLYTLTVTNLGPAPATGVTITDVLPPTLTLVSSSGCAEDPAGLPQCSVGDLAVGASASVQLTTQVAVPPPASVTNVANVSAIESDPQPANNTASQSTQLDAVAPQVLAVSTEPTTADGVLSECETVHAQPVVALRAAFSEPVVGAGQSSAWRLLAPGADLSFQSSGCDMLAGDDQWVPLTTVEYDPAGPAARIQPAALTAGQYRLIGCSAALTDVAGNPLDGNADGLPGGDFQRAFRTDPANQFANGHFDCGLQSWVVAAGAAGSVQADPLDHASSPHSGSALANHGGSANAIGLGQCVNVAGGTDYQYGLHVRMQSGDPLGDSLALICSAYASTDCSGAPLQAPVSANLLLADTAGAFVRLQTTLRTPPAAASQLCSVDLVARSGQPFSAWLDRVELSGGDLLLQDGFEDPGTVVGAQGIIRQ